MKVKSLSRVWLFATWWTIACQALPSMGFSRQEYSSGLPFPSPGESSQPRDWTQVPCIAGWLFTAWATRESRTYLKYVYSVIHINWLILIAYLHIWKHICFLSFNVFVLSLFLLFLIPLFIFYCLPRCFTCTVLKYNILCSFLVDFLGIVVYIYNLK